MEKLNGWLTKQYVALATFRDEAFAAQEGQTLAEYGLILFLIAVVSLLALTFLGSSIRDNMYYIINDAFGAL